MPFKILKEQSYGSLTAPYTIPQILELNSESNEIIKVYDTKPNLVALLDSAIGKIVLKRFGWRSFFHFLISPFMYSRARMSWETANKLDKIEITPKPLFVYTKTILGFKYDNFFITKAIEPHKKLRRFLIEEPNPDKLKTVLHNAAISIAKMHDSGIYHRDLTTGNFLINDNLNIFIVDLNRARNVKNLSIQQRLRDLSKIHFPKMSVLSRDLLVDTFFQYYNSNSKIDIDWKTEYWKYRRILVKRRKLSKKFKQFFRSNN